MENSKVSKILIIDADFKSTDIIKKASEQRRSKFVVIPITDPEIGIEMVWKDKPSVVIVEKNLPNMSGWDVIGILKKNDLTKEFPIIMLDSQKKINHEEEIKAIDLGVNYYLNKPFIPDLLLSYIKALVHRNNNDSNKESKDDKFIKSGNIELSFETHVASVKSKAMELTPKEFSLLYLFMKKKNRVLNRVFLSETIWECEYQNTSHTIDKHVANLRKKLGTEGSRIETFPTVGYKFIETEGQ